MYYVVKFDAEFEEYVEITGHRRSSPDQLITFQTSNLMTLKIDKVKSGPSKTVEIEVLSRLTAIDLETRSADDGYLIDQ